MKPQLLTPAGNLQKLKWAVAYGADAVYFGTKFGSLRNFAGNFSLEDVDAGLKYLNAHNKKGYVALNIYPFSDEYAKIIDTAKALDDMGADALIVSDIGVLAELRKLGLKTNIHISTQANTTSCQAALAYRQLGATRVNLARELSLERIQHIQSRIASRIETEVFIHGAVCFSYSGRCAISDYLTGHSANHGACKHPCRWKYALVEENRPGQYIPVSQDERGTYLFNSKDLALFEYIDDLAACGVNSFKIEGRNKSIHYIASVVSLYRQLIDGSTITKKRVIELLSRVPNRGYSAGFMKGEIGPQDYQWQQDYSAAEAIFVGNVTGEKVNGKTVVEVRNKIHAGDQLETLTPAGDISTIKMPTPLTEIKAGDVDFANNSQFVLIDQNLPEYSILRRIKD
jgi:U32 family peptidase